MSRRNKTKQAETGIPVLDAFSNPLFRLGHGSQAPLEAAEYPLTRLTDNYALLNSLYRCGGICRSVVSIIPNDMTRKWYEFGMPVPPERKEALVREERRTGLKNSINEGLQLGSLYGGAAGLIRIRGHEEALDAPLDLDAVLPGSFEGLQLFERWCGVEPEESLVFHRGQLAPEYYRITDEKDRISVRVHYSRIVRFTGGMLPYLERIAERYWGESDIEPIYDDIVLYDSVMHNMGNLTFRANLDTMEVQNLDQLFSLSSGEAQRRFWNTMQAQSVLRSNFGMQLVNRGDKIYNTQYGFTGFDHVIEGVQLNLSAKTHIPLTRLFGRAPAGLNATGESDLKTYYEYIDTLRESRLRDILDQVLPVLCASAWGSVPDDLDITFPPLWTPTAKELAEIAEKKAQAVRDAFQAGLIRADTAMRELKKLSNETGLFASITDEEIAANAGKTYQDVTALRDPLLGLGYEGEESGPFEQDTGDGFPALDYNPHHDPSNGRFTNGGGSGKIGKTKYAPSPQRSHAGIQLKPKTYARLCGTLGTRFPGLKDGEIRKIRDAKYEYTVRADGYGGFTAIDICRLK